MNKQIVESQPDGTVNVSRPLYDQPFCGACNDNHAKDAVCIAGLESAVIEAAVHRRESELQLGEVLWEWDDDLTKAVDALIQSREK